MKHDNLGRWLGRGLAAFAMLAASAGIAAAQSEADLYAAAKKEGAVNWYTGLVQQQVVRPIVAGFEAKYPGITVNITGGRDNDFLTKILSEAKAGKLEADMTDGPSVFGPLKKAGLAASYKAQNAAGVPDQYKDAAGEWTALIVYFLVPAINTELVGPEDEPKSLDDLLDPKWKGKIAWSGEMTVGGPPGFIGAILATMGDEKGMAYLKKLSAQEIATIPANPRVVLDQVIAGQYAIGLVTYNHHSVISASKGAPVKWLPISPAVGAMARSVLIAGGPHPNAAKLLLNYLLSPEGGKVISDANYIPSNPAVPPKEPKLLPQNSNFTAYAPTPEDEAKNLDKWISIYKELF
ncbi:extracellular solute-binding protein [Mesorhizobium sp. 8]|uniref:ABC transporter substrate-binding protein n=1 Tax=Mesorhizobium sp. 8 TaxID=2584466 RepID=UPI0015D66624|nr:extracellular solute-binding protein [Mesorhizobium sp. 8]